jgi:hypothetical protein
MRTDFYARVRRVIIVAAAILAAPLAACASEPKPRPTALDPSNPTAPEGARFDVAALSAAAAPASPPASTAARDEKAPAAPAPAADHGHDHGGTAPPAKKDKPGEADKPKKPSAAVYTCPMDPEVTSDKPGKCPKCGMKLVPKDPAEGKK